MAPCFNPLTWSSGAPDGQNADNWPVGFLFGEWIPASMFLGFAFLVAAIGVVGLGWWVLRADAINRRVEAGSTEESSSHH